MQAPKVQQHTEMRVMLDSGLCYCGTDDRNDIRSGVATEVDCSFARGRSRHAVASPGSGMREGAKLHEHYLSHTKMTQNNTTNKVQFM